jgi:osmotically inducible protein OsmC
LDIGAHLYGIQLDWLESVMAITTANAEWHEDLAHGSGHMRFGSGAFDGPYDFRSGMGEGKGRNPEELLGAAHAGCFSMALVLQLTNAGFTVKSIDTTAKAHFEERDGGSSIHRIDLDTEASISNVTAAAFEEYAQTANKNCPVSRVLSSVDIHLRAKLL